MSEAEAGDIQWNFEKFPVSRKATDARFRPRTVPDDRPSSRGIRGRLPA